MTAAMFCELVARKAFFFCSIGAVCDVIHGQNVKRKERKRKKTKNEQRKEQQPVILNALLGNTQLLNRIILSASMTNISNLIERKTKLIN